MTFRVVGTPQSQGSKTARIVGKRVRIKGVPAVIEPRVAMVELADMTKKTRPRGQLTNWRALVRHEARRVMGGREPYQGPVHLGCEFVFQRPPSHLNAAREVKPAFREKLPHRDLSKLVRAVEDALTGVVYRDDVLIAGSTSSKGYSSTHLPQFVGVFVRVKAV